MLCFCRRLVVNIPSGMHSILCVCVSSFFSAAAHFFRSAVCAQRCCIFLFQGGGFCSIFYFVGIPLVGGARLCVSIYVDRTEPEKALPSPGKVREIEPRDCLPTIAEVHATFDGPGKDCS